MVEMSLVSWVETDVIVLDSDHTRVLDDDTDASFEVWYDDTPWLIVRVMAWATRSVLIVEVKELIVLVIDEACVETALLFDNLKEDTSPDVNVADDVNVLTDEDVDVDNDAIIALFEV